MQIRIAILANKDLSKLSKKAAKDLSKLSKSFFWVDGKKFAHHITLFDIFVTSSDISRASKVVEDLTSKKSEISLVVNNLWKSPTGVGYIGFKIKHTKELLNFKKKLFKNLEKFKPENVGKTYNAHITLARYKDFGFADKARLKNKIQKAFNFNTIIFGKTDKHGQIYKILKEFKLKA
jgi:2'-5' RNA ligase